MSDRDQLDTAYRRTVYRVAGRIAVRIGSDNRELARWMLAQGIQRWAVITAFNPASRVSDEAANRCAQQALEALLTGRGYLLWPAVGDPAPESDWSAETSVFVAGIEAADAVEVANRFGQNAIVVSGEQPGEARLHYCQPG